MTEDWIVPLMLLAVFGGGLGVGLLLGLRTNSARRHARWLEHELENTRSELTRYQQQVTNHFAETAQVFNTLSDNYQAVYRHLASGCQELCRGEHPHLARHDGVSQIETAAGDAKRQVSPPRPDTQEGLGIG